MSNGSTLPPTGGFAELGISYSTLQSTCNGTLKSLTRYAVAAADPDDPPDLDLDDEDDVEADDEDADDEDADDDDEDPTPADAAIIAADGTPAAAASGLGYDP